MKSKKIIAFLCAAAMTTSAFAGLTITASAADTTEFSDNFDSQTFGMIVDGTNTDTATEDTIVPGLKFVTTSRTGGDRGVYVDSNGDTVYTGSYYSIEEKSDSDNYLHLSLPMFGDFTVDNAKNRDGNGRYGHVDFIDSSKAPKTYTADATKDVVFDFDMKMNDGILKGVVEDQKPAVIRFGTFDSSAKTANAVVIDKAALSIGDEWVHARIVATNAGSKVYINGEEKTAAASNVKEFASIGLYTEATTTPPIDAKGDWLNADTPTKTPSIDIDNFVIYTTDAGTATATSTAPAATAQTPGGQINPMPTPYVIPTAPTLVAPKAADADSVEVYRFDNDDTNAWYIQSDEQNITDISGLNIHFGGKTNGEASTFAQITKAKTGKVLQMQAGKFSHAGRGPLLSVNTSMPVSYADGISTAMSMNVMLSAPKGMETGAAPRLYFLKSDSKAGEDKQGAYNQVAAVLTTDIDEKIYRSGEGSDVLSAFITPDEWHTVTLVITPSQNGATHRLFIDGAKDAAVRCDYVGSGDTASYMDNLPLLSPESKSASNDAAPDYSLVTIDNLLVYQGTNPEEPRSLVAGASSGEVTDPTPKPTAVPSHSVAITQAADNKQSVTVTSTDEADAAFDGVLIHAAYNTSNTLKSVKTYDLKNINKTGATVAIPDTDKVYEGDKLMVWNNLKDMVPYGTATAEGETPAATYAVSVGNLTGGTITAAPAADITAGTEVTLTVTPADGKQLKEGTLKVMNGSEEVTVTNNKFTMPAANVTVTAEFEDIPAPVTKYTVVITADEHIQDVKLGTKTGTKSGNDFTFTEVEAGAYDFDVTYENGYEKADASPASITVSADKLTETISSKKSADPAITGTVAITGNPVVGQTLTANVTGLNDGKTAKYQWQANTGAEGAYADIADATAATFVVPDTLVGKTIKVVVTADGTSGKLTSDATAAVTAPTYTVSGTVDAGVNAVALTPAAGEAINGTITDTAVSFANVPAGEYTVTVTLKDGYKDAVVKLGTDAAADNKITVTNADVTNLAITSTAKVSSAVTFAAAENGNAYTVSVDNAAIASLDTVQEGKEVTIAATPAEGYAVGTIAVAPTNNESTTTVTVTNGKFTMPAEAVTITVPFTYTGEFTFDVDATYVNFQDSTKATSYIGERPIAGNVKVVNGTALAGQGDSVDAASVAIFSFDASKVANKVTKATLKFDAQDKSGSNNTAFRNWGVFQNYIDFDAVDSNGITAENLATLAGPIANSVAMPSTDWTYGTPNGKEGTTKGDKCTIEMDITDLVKADADGRITMYLGTGTARATYVDNFSVEVESTQAKSYKVITTTIPETTDGTLTVDKRFGAVDEVITITPTAATGRKLKKVMVNSAEKAENAGAYTHTIVEGDPDNIVVSAEFTRADAAAAEISGANLVKKGTSSDYTIKLYDGDDAATRHELTQEAGDVTWSVEGGVSGTTAADGTLTIAADETATELTVKATYKKNTLQEATGDNAGTATFTVKVAATDVYTLTAANAEHGSFTISKDLAEAGDAITVTTTPDLGYRVALTDGVVVAPTAAAVTTSEANKTYTFNMPASNTTVTVNFEPDTYTLTPGDGTKDNPGTANKVAVSVDGTPVTSAAEVAYGKTVTLTPTLDDGSALKTLTVKGTTTNLALADLTKNGNAYTFTMPGENVTVEATFGTPATVSVVYTTDGTAEGKVASEVIYDGWTGDDASSTDVSAYDFAANQIVKLHTSETYPTAYKKYKVPTATTVAMPAGSDNLTAGDHPVYVTVEADTDTSLYYYEEDFDSLAAETVWGETVSGNSFSKVVTSDYWPTGKIGGFIPGKNSDDKLTENNHVVLLATHKVEDNSISKNVPGAGNKTISFKLAKNESSSGRSQLFKFVDENGAEVLRIKISMQNSKLTEHNGVYYSVDSGANYVALTTADSTAWHTYSIDFDMTSKKIGITFDGGEPISVDMASGITGTTIDKFNVVSGYSVVSAVIDDFVVKEYTPVTP